MTPTPGPSHKYTTGTQGADSLEPSGGDAGRAGGY